MSRAVFPSMSRTPIPAPCSIKTLTTFSCPSRAATRSDDSFLSLRLSIGAKLSARYWTMFTCPPFATIWSAVEPDASAAHRFASFLTRTLATLRWPLLTATCSAVYPLLFCNSTLARCSHRYWTVATCPDLHAACNGLSPLSAINLMSSPMATKRCNESINPNRAAATMWMPILHERAFRSSRRRVICILSLRTATSRGLIPTLLCEFTSEFLSTKYCTIRLLSLHTALNNGLSPFKFCTSKSTPLCNSKFKISQLSFSAAKCAMLFPFPSLSSTLPPCCTINPTVFWYPFMDAARRAVMPSLSRSEMLALCWRSNSTIFVFPRLAAMWSGVWSAEFIAFTSAPSFSKHFTVV